MFDYNNVIYFAHNSVKQCRNIVIYDYNYQYVCKFIAILHGHRQRDSQCKISIGICEKDQQNKVPRSRTCTNRAYMQA